MPKVILCVDNLPHTAPGISFTNPVLTKRRYGLRATKRKLWDGKPLQGQIVGFSSWSQQAIHLGRDTDAPIEEVTLEGLISNISRGLGFFHHQFGVEYPNLTAFTNPHHMFAYFTYMEGRGVKHSTFSDLGNTAKKVINWLHTSSQLGGTPAKQAAAVEAYEEWLAKLTKQHMLQAKSKVGPLW